VRRALLPAEGYKVEPEVLPLMHLNLVNLLLEAAPPAS
jgi:hypothetical protein